MGLPAVAMWLLPLLLIPLLVVFKKLKAPNKQRQKQLPPSPPTLPVIGNLHQLGELPHKSLWQLSKNHGPIMLLKFGRVPAVVISSADAARDVLKDHDVDCCNRPQLSGCGKLSYNYSDISFSPYGGYWREMRKVSVLELLSLKKVNSFRPIREEEVDFLMKSISSSSASPVDLSEKIFCLTGSIVFRMAFGKRFQGSRFDNHRFQELVHEAESVVGGFTAAECFPYYLGWIFDRLNGYHAKLQRVFSELDGLFQEIIDDHLIKPETTKQEQEEDFIDGMLKLERDPAQFKGESWLNKDHIKAVLMNVFLGGVDTTGLNVIWAMAELMKNPRAMKKAQAEIRRCTGEQGRVTEADLDQLQYLKMVIKETMRLHPPAPLLLRRDSMYGFKVQGYEIDPQMIIQVNVWAIGRDPKYWENPEEFIPERFADNSVDFKGQHFQYLPFGSGRRVCPGMNMGFITVELALANLLYCFDWKLPNGSKEDDFNMEEATGASLTLPKKTPLLLVPIKYQQQ